MPRTSAVVVRPELLLLGAAATPGRSNRPPVLASACSAERVAVVESDESVDAMPAFRRNDRYPRVMPGNRV
jgi:hypothetical protein